MALAQKTGESLEKCIQTVQEGNQLARQGKKLFLSLLNFTWFRGDYNGPNALQSCLHRSPPEFSMGYSQVLDCNIMNSANKLLMFTDGEVENGVGCTVLKVLSIVFLCQ